MDRIYLLSPAIALTSVFVTAFVVYCGMCAMGRPPKVRHIKHNELFGLFFARYLLWLVSPIEKLLVGRVTPNTITTVSLLGCVATGVAAALGHLAIAVWLYVFSGILDILDGRLARIGNMQTKSGAMFDSVSDRWGELAIFTGYAWYLRETPWLLAVMGALAGSMMVSYTRARAEGLGLDLRGGLMQRAERIVLVTGGTLIAAWFGAAPETAYLVSPILGITMSICALASTGTALSRWVGAMRELSHRDDNAAVVETVAPIADSDPNPAPAPIFVPKTLRESAELGL